MSRSRLSAAQVRARLPHPVIDADGHWLEFGPTIREHIRKIGGEQALRGFTLHAARIEEALSLSVPERRARRIAQNAWWTLPTRNTRDRATAMLPALLEARMDELGFDFAVLFPSIGSGLARIPDAQQRRAACRAFNTFSAEYFAPHAGRMTPVAMIPMHTPEEAIAELEHVVRQLGLKAVCLGSLIPRSGAGGTWLDALGLDSACDYDPLWAKCVELGVSPTFHSGSRGFGSRVSPSNLTYNHIGHFAAAGEAVCKALYLGGVTRRFPQLKFAFLEGGVGWACQLLADLVAHWQKRNLRALAEVDPDNLDAALLRQLAERYGSPAIARALVDGEAALDTVFTPRGARLTGGLAQLDDYAACGIDTPQEVAALFVESFYFGCEADDPMNAWAFDRRTNPFGSKLRALFGSDIGHFDVPDMAAVLPEAYELLDEGLLDENDFRAFVFGNAVRFWASANPAFFAGTRIPAT